MPEEVEAEPDACNSTAVAAAESMEQPSLIRWTEEAQTDAYPMKSSNETAEAVADCSYAHAEEADC